MCTITETICMLRKIVLEDEGMTESLRIIVQNVTQ